MRRFIAERSEGFEDFKAMVEKYTPEYVAEICGIDACDLVAAAKLYGEAVPLLSCTALVLPSIPAALKA